MPQFPELDRVAQHPSPRFTADELADLLGLDRRAVIRGIEGGDLPGTKVGGHYYAPRVAVYRYLTGAWPDRRAPRRVVVERVTRRLDAHRYLRAYRRA